MPKKSTKSKSKRLTLRQKHKIMRKVKQHHKKKRREERKNGPKKFKDPGLPSQWPYKEQLVQEFAMKRAQILADEKRKKEEAKARREARDAMDQDGGNELLQLASLQAKAKQKEAEFESRKRARLTDEFTSDKDNSRKAFYREFKKVVELADVVIQVLDARDPLACRCLDVERYIRSTNPNKKIILLLNKMDLVPREVGEKWLKYFREELPTVAFKCSTQQQDRGLGQRKLKMNSAGPNRAFKERQEAKYGGGSSNGKEEDALQSSACLGADTLIQLLKNYTRNSGIKTSITVGVVGLPNVGKSSLINSLKRARVAQVGNMPGVTKAVQEIVLDKHIKLLDSPGVVFVNAESDAAAVLRNCIKIERLEDPLAPVAEVLKRVPAKQLMQLYKIQAFKTPEEFLQLVALARGKLRKGGTPDMPAAARVVLQDWNDGKIPYFTQPPKRDTTGLEAAEIVGNWAAEFNADEVFANERSAVIAHLPSMDDDKRSFFETQTVGLANADLQAMEEDGNDDDEDDYDDEGPSGMEEDDMIAAAAAALQRREAAKAAAAGSSQNAALYDEEGIFNPHAARADRKRLKKARLSGEPLPPPAAKKADDDKKKKKKPHAYGDADSDDDFVFDNSDEEEGDGEEEGSEDDGSEGGEGEEGSEEDDSEMES